MRKITREMLKIYKPLSGLDWMNYRIYRDEDLTFHHIIKKNDGGKNRIDNGALLLPAPHQYLHLIESIDKDVYRMLNDIFKMINRQGYEPTIGERLVIENLLCNFEDKHKNDIGYNGKVLIKAEYTLRDF